MVIPIYEFIGSAVEAIGFAIFFSVLWNIFFSFIKW